MATSLPWLPFYTSNHHLSSAVKQRRQSNGSFSTHYFPVIKSFRRSDFDDFSKRMASGEALRDAWRSANGGFEQFVYDVKKATERFDRQYSVSRRLDSVTRYAMEQARRIDREYSIGQKWRNFTVDFRRNWPRYKKELDGILETPLGRGAATIFFLWFALSGWMFNLLIISMWVLPFAAPLVIGTIANNFVIEGSCPACKQQFMGYKNQVIQCRNCRNIVWQPKDDFSRKSRNSSTSGPDIIDIEIEEK